ncbi:MAG: SCO family protein [Candidatus Poseidoniaceae archaeon]|nr:SCO family protein [Candidatus Poseidoniaceae archaeon]MBL6890062.1 SCO family protein [Candidatus Poseidoniaceae archaeon]|tara:strand:+ start:3408 stop:4028 length:621 start_codon:yes stop_codon:yes gene_type:complete
MRILIAVMTVAMLCSGCIGTTDFYGNTLEPKPVSPFELFDDNGDKFNLSMIDSDVIMVGFIHTSCLDECDALTNSMNESYNLLSAQEQQRVSLLTITTDPWHDNSNRLYHYKNNNSVEWPHLTVSNINSELAMIESVWASFGTSVEVSANQTQSLARCSIHLMDYTVNQTVHAILIDSDRNVRVQWLESEWNSDNVAADIRKLTSE